MQETWLLSLDWEDPLEKGMATHSSILPGELHEWRSLVGYSPWDHEESDTTEQLTLALFSHMYLCVDTSESGKYEVQAITGTLGSTVTQCAHRQFYLSFFDLV